MFSFNNLGGGSNHDINRKLKDLCKIEDPESNTFKKFICIPNYHEISCMDFTKSVSADDLI
jgi:hypothetical protein